MIQLSESPSLALGHRNRSSLRALGVLYDRILMETVAQKAASVTPHPRDNSQRATRIDAIKQAAVLDVMRQRPVVFAPRIGTPKSC
jgi:hypothetical protein